MVWGLLACYGSGSCGSESRDKGISSSSSSRQFYGLVGEGDDVPLDDHTPATPLGNDVDLVAQPGGDATMATSMRRGPKSNLENYFIQLGEEVNICFNCLYLKFITNLFFIP